LEWGESLGADIASSSLGYIDWYEFEDLDGTTAVTTIAVNTAIENGMVVVTAVGNSGTGGIVVPADSENVIACGAVDSNGNIASFSSQGPTADGRIKPEVCALGVSTYCAGVNSTSAYRYENGSSLATPLVAGAAACVLQAHPDWTPQQVREALMMTASDPENPDNQYGWGIIDVIEAINYNNPNPFYPVYYTLSNPFPNPFNSWIQFDVGIYSEGKVILTVFDINGKEIERLWSNNIEKGVYPIQWNADGVSSGVYFINLNGKNGSVNRKICLQK
jgi:subtilisin family serine protease